MKEILQEKNTPLKQDQGALRECEEKSYKPQGLLFVPVSISL